MFLQVSVILSTGGWSGLVLGGGSGPRGEGRGHLVPGGSGPGGVLQFFGGSNFGGVLQFFRGVSKFSPTPTLIQLMSRRYASYWNAFLLRIISHLCLILHIHHSSVGHNSCSRFPYDSFNGE